MAPWLAPREISSPDTFLTMCPSIHVVLGAVARSREGEAEGALRSQASEVSVRERRRGRSSQVPCWGTGTAPAA